MKKILNLTNLSKCVLEGLLDEASDRKFITLGRMGMRDFMPEDSISRWHATVIANKRNLYLVDHSKNGTWTGHSDDATIDAEGVPTSRTESILLSKAFSRSQEQACEAMEQSGYVAIPPRIGDRDRCQTGAKFDRSTFDSYVYDVAAFIKSQSDPSTLANYASLGTLLRPGLRISFGKQNNLYEYIV